MHYRQRESGCHRGIHGISAGLHHLDPGARGQLVNAHHDPVLRVHGLG
jgi:hypothetical protein